MKLETLVGIFFLLCTFMVPTALASGGDAIGSLPAATAEGNAVNVPPKKSHTNDDGVTVDNKEKSKGNVRVTPKIGDEDSQTTVTCKNGAIADITGLDSNDTCDVGANCNVTISAAGSTITMAGGSTATVTNTGSSPLVVHTPAGGSTSIPAGNSATINT